MKFAKFYRIMKRGGFVPEFKLEKIGKLDYPRIFEAFKPFVFIGIFLIVITMPEEDNTKYDSEEFAFKPELNYTTKLYHQYLDVLQIGVKPETK